MAGYLAGLMTLQAAVFTTLGALAPFIRTSLDISTSAMGVIGAAPYIGTGLAAAWLGTWVDAGRPARVIAVTTAGMATALAAVAASLNVAMLMAGFLLAGVARSAVPPLTDRLGYELCPVDSRGLVFGIKQMGTPAGAGLVSLTLPTIAASSAGWRGAIACLAVVVVLVGLPLSRTVPSARPTPTGPPQDTPEEPAPAHGDDSPQPPPHRPATASARMLATVRPLAPVMTFSFGMGVFISATMTFLTLFFVDTVGLDPVTAGAWFALFSVGGAIGRIAWGWASDALWSGRRGYPLVACALTGGTVAICLGAIPDLLIGVLGPLTALLFGLVAQGWVGLSRAFGAETLGRGRAGRAGGVLLSSMMAGGLFGPVLFGAAVGVTGGYGPSWIAMGTIALLTAAMVLPSAVRERSPRTY
ncbi:hypothetical protein GCM10022402_31700 [Salinactinospora qingdaonensis]|uniref:Major facilitator superfamily (MFS) profile domain-containing protein n=1 Tax=Salinactinospora qingdaonensis TaxID=702744 RepID=A0ABP7FXC0_9ACTN